MRGSLILVIASLMVCSFAVDCAATCIDGVDPEALKGITDEQIAELCSKGILMVGELEGAGEDNFLMSLLIFEQPREEVFKLLCATDREIEYLPRIIEEKVIQRTETQDTVEFYVGASLFKFRYQVNHRYNKDKWMLDWNLNPDFDNEVQRVDGSYRLYELPDGRTLARYQTLFSVSAAIPKSIQNMLAKGDLPESLAYLKKWVDSGGTWRRPEK